MGDPARVQPPDRNHEIWAVQRELDFPGTVLGIERGAPAAEATARYARLFGRHRDDRVIG
ncbi:MAG: gamma-carbonic anhydrase [Solirubrobacteraceae bacterium]